MDIREYTRDEFNKFIEQHNLESFTHNQVDAFSHDIVEKAQKNELNDFEIYCAAAEYEMLEKAIVIENDLTKSLVYYRPTQVEVVEIPVGIFKSINDKSSLRYKETPLNILKGIVGINCADEDAIEKAKALPIGTEKTYGGKLYVKTDKGWRLKTKGTRSAAKQEADKTPDGSSKENKVQHEGKTFNKILWDKVNENAGKILSESGIRYDKVFPIRRSGDAFVIPYLGKGAKNPSTVLYTMDGSHALGASSSKIIKKLAEEARKEEKGL